MSEPERPAAGDPTSAARSAADAHAAAGVPLSWSAPFAELSLRQRFQSRSRQVQEADVLAFCALTGDWHPQHWDAQWSASSAFGERIAHGMLVLSLAVGLVPLDPRRVKALRRIGDAVFKRPVRLGEQISVSGEVIGLKPLQQGAGLVELRWAICNELGALVCRATVQVLWSGGPIEEEQRHGGPPPAEFERFWREALPGAPLDAQTPFPA